MTMARRSNALLDPKTMDGPVVKTTVADIFKPFPTLFLTYHSMESGFGYLSLVGALTGGASHYIARNRPFPHAIQTIGTGSVIGGCVGMALGLAAVAGIASKGPEASPPWTMEGKQQRIDGLSHNFKVRVLDLGVWSGLSFAAGTLAVMGGPMKLRFSAGPLGVAQALCIGSAAGSILSIGCVAYHESKLLQDDDDDDD
jgi:hypothetical protein